MSRNLEVEGFFDWTPDEQERVVTEIAESFLNQVFKMKSSLKLAKEHLNRLIFNAIENEDYEVAEIFQRILLTIDSAMEYENELRERDPIKVNLNRNINL